MKIHSILTSVALVFLAACGDSKKEAPAASGESTNGNTLPATLLADKAPDGALNVVAARAAAKPGDPIVLHGKVGGKMKPFSDAVAVMVLADLEAITSCDKNPDDGCETPWDFCCEEPAKIAASTATIQATGADGKVLRSTFRGLGGIKELSELVIAGTVDKASTPEALIVNATSIHVEKP